MTQQRSVTVMDGATAPLRQGTARRLLGGNDGRRDCSSTARDSAQRECGGDRPREQRRWAAMDGVMVN